MLHYSIWLRSHKFTVMPPFLSCNPVPQQILLALPSDYVQNLTTSHHLHCNPPVQVSVAWNTYMILHLQSLLPYLPTTVWMPHTVLERSFQNIVLSCPSLSQISPMTSHLTETNPSPSHGFLRPYMICFPSTSQASSSATVSLAHSTPAIQSSLMLLPNTLLSQSLPFTATSLTSAFPHISPSPFSHIRSLFESHLIKEVFHDHFI